MAKEDTTIYKDAFNLFDKDKDGKITTQDLGTVMRSVGSNITQAELKEMIKEIDTDGSGLVDFQQFTSLLQRKTQYSDSEADIKQAFKTFDKKGNGYAPIADLKHTLTTIGEKLTKEEFDNILKDAKVVDGQIHVDEFIRIIKSSKAFIKQSIYSVLSYLYNLVLVYLNNVENYAHK
ncbi:calmodulin-like protein [Heterostelium album PN500]|uniref:Calmodulin-like protein n=1 Tax=Heterostelium pallidum (strain ATCC 26659 / Pp 5 / PN500) TaxID=670386 RepID=D3AY54_HETP5|nr:calmodulin-like protein [Heterostelium album PN500]EFA85881.1 calmodulin-like protein [Heterostelium album PN500]|eukprot:XP_020437987.1 calmodulin-like protein [Heterostelium album PN500]